MPRAQQLPRRPHGPLRPAVPVSGILPPARPVLVSSSSPHLQGGTTGLPTCFPSLFSTVS